MKEYFKKDNIIVSMFEDTPFTALTLFSMLFASGIVSLGIAPILSILFLLFLSMCIAVPFINIKYIFNKIRRFFKNKKNKQEELNGSWDRSRISNTQESNIKSTSYIDRINKNPLKDIILDLIKHSEMLLSQNLTNSKIRSELLIIKDKQILQIINNYDSFSPFNSIHKKALLEKTKEQLDLIKDNLNKIEHLLVEEQNHKLEVNKKYLKEKSINL